MLVRTPAPKHTESLIGYVLRISEENGYDTPRHITSYSGVNLAEYLTAGFPIKNLAKVLGRETDELEHISYKTLSKNDKQQFKILNHPLGISLKKGYFRLRKPAICPHCILENGFIDAFFDLSCAIACPHHHCKLLDTCAECDEPLNWSRPGLLTCKCGANYANSSLEPAEQRVVEFMAIVKSKLEGKSILNNPNSAGFPLNFLERISLLSLLWIISGLGTFKLFSQGSKTGNTWNVVTPSAAEVLSDWPIGYHQFLQSLGSTYKASRPKSIGFRSQFQPYYYALLKTNSSSGETKFLRDEFVRFGQTTWGEATVDAKLLRGEDTESENRYISLAMAARNIGIRPITLKGWCKKGLISSKEITVGKQHRYIIDAETIAIGNQTPGRVMQARVAAKYLGIPVSVLVSLKKSGHFNVNNMPIHKSGFHEVDLDNFLEKMLTNSQLFIGEVTNDDHVVPLGKILKEGKFWSQISKANFVANYIDGNTQSVCRTDDSVQSIYFKSIDVQAITKSSRNTLDQQGAAKYIGCPSAAIPVLIEQGYLKGTKGLGRFNIEWESVEKFSTKYIPLSKLALKLNTSSTNLKRLCRTGEIQPVSIPLATGRVSIFIQHQHQDEIIMLFRLLQIRT